MIFDPKTVNGDIIASLASIPATLEGLTERFDNHENGLLRSALVSVVNGLEKRGLVRLYKNGKYAATKAGKEYIRRKGYFD